MARTIELQRMEGKKKDEPLEVSDNVVAIVQAIKELCSELKQLRSKI